MSNIFEHDRPNCNLATALMRPGPSRAARPDFEIHHLNGPETLFPTANVYESVDRIELLWIRHGRCLIDANGKANELTEKSIFCILPGQLRRYDFGSSFVGDYISFTLEFIRISEGYSTGSAWIERYTNPITRICVDDDIQYELDVIMSKMKREYGNYFNCRQEVIKGLLNIFLIYLSRTLKDPNPTVEQTREFELVSRFLSLLKHNFKSKKMVSGYANDLCVSPNYLNRTIKKLTGYPASHHITQQIILEAKRQALYKTVSMKEVAYDLGFDNTAHFSKFFKNNCGMNFTDFKKETFKQS